MYLDPKFVKKMPQNIEGRDFVVGDLHGCYDELCKLLEHIKFDYQKDRLFSTGDLIDRGPKSEKCLELLEKDWFYSVLGNHEDLILNNIKSYELHNNVELTEEELMVLKSGGKHINNIFNLPLIYEIDHLIHGKIYIVHAEILPEHLIGQDYTTSPKEYDKYFASMKKYDFSNQIENFIEKNRNTTIDYDLKQKLIWSRKFSTSFYKEHQELIEINDFDFMKQECFNQKVKIFCGHNVVPFPIKIGQQYYIDTGCALGYATKELNSYLFTQFGHQYFALSLVDLATGFCYGCISTPNSRGQVVHLEKSIYSI